MTPFDGILFDQTGAVVRGEEQGPLDDERLASMSWLAPNVVGRIPLRHELADEVRGAVEVAGVVPVRTEGEGA